MEMCRFLYIYIYMRNHLRSIELRQNKRVDKFAGKSIWHTFRERVHVFEIVAIAKIPNLLAPIEEIGYFTLIILNFLQ